jgi:hypothetical protein
MKLVWISSFELLANTIAANLQIRHAFFFERETVRVNVSFGIVLALFQVQYILSYSILYDQYTFVQGQSGRESPAAY